MKLSTKSALSQSERNVLDSVLESYREMPLIELLEEANAYETSLDRRTRSNKMNQNDRIFMNYLGQNLYNEIERKLR